MQRLWEEVVLQTWVVAKEREVGELGHALEEREGDLLRSRMWGGDQREGREQAHGAGVRSLVGHAELEMARDPRGECQAHGHVGPDGGRGQS